MTKTRPLMMAVRVPMLMMMSVALGSCGTAAQRPVTLTAAPIDVEARVKRLASCPSAVSGASTAVAEIGGGVELRVTGGSDDATTEIQRRALALVRSRVRDAHRGTGAIAGRFGRCPVVMRNTTVSFRDIPTGVVITVRPADAKEVHWLRRETETRAAQIENPATFGPGKMALCPNAVVNARTTVLDAAYGADVEITSASGSSVQAIRDRAMLITQQVVPGELGDRCPVAIPRAILKAYEMPNGVRLAVHAAGPDEVDAIRRLARERAADFEAATQKLEASTQKNVEP